MQRDLKVIEAGWKAQTEFMDFASSYNELTIKEKIIQENKLAQFLRIAKDIITIHF